MGKDYDYVQELKLRHDQVAAIFTPKTGDVEVKPLARQRLPEGKEIFEKSGIFNKTYNNTWNFLDRELSAIEFRAASALSRRATSCSNTLEPLNDDTAYSYLSMVLSVSKNKVKAVLEVLFDYGVYGKFEIKKADKPYTKYWVLNPYLSFNGRLIESDVAELFKDTHCERAFRNPNYRFKGKK